MSLAAVCASSYMSVTAFTTYTFLQPYWYSIECFKKSTKAKLFLSLTYTFFLHRMTTGAQLRWNTAVASQNTANTSRFPLPNRNQYLPVFIYSSEISSLVTLSIQPSFPFFSTSTFQRLLVFFCLSE